MGHRNCRMVSVGRPDALASDLGNFEINSTGPAGSREVKTRRCTEIQAAYQPQEQPQHLGRDPLVRRTGEESVRYAAYGQSPVGKGQKGPISVSTLGSQSPLANSGFVQTGNGIIK